MTKIFSYYWIFVLKAYCWTLETTLSIGLIEQPLSDGLMEQVFKLMRICFELKGAMPSYCGVFSTHTLIGYSPFVLIYYISHEPQPMLIFIVMSYTLYKLFKGHANVGCTLHETSYYSSIESMILCQQALATSCTEP